MRIDAQVSLWREAPEAARIDPRFPGASRHYLPEHLEPILLRNRFDGALVFSAGADEGESASLIEWAQELQWAKEHSAILGLCLAWGDADSPPDALAHALEPGILRGIWIEAASPHLAQAAMFCHRHALALDVRFPRFEPAFDALHQEGVFHLDVPIVLADAGSPPLASADLEAWMEHMRSLARLPNLHCKLSALWSSALAEWNISTLQSLFAFLIEEFGEHRLLFGSDWPYCLPSHSWKECLARFTQALGARPMNFRESVLGDNAARIYGIQPPVPLAA